MTVFVSEHALSPTRGHGAPQGLMIEADRDFGTAPILRRFFTVEPGHGPVRSAVMTATALGLCEVTLNGSPVTPDLLTPGWSSYEWRLRYARWDVTSQLATENVIGMTIGRGWHSGRLGYAGLRAVYGDRRAVLADLEITFEDGHTQLISTDEQWDAGPSSITADDLYDGEHIDARLRDNSWATPGPAPQGWSTVRVIDDFDRSRLVPFLAPPIRRQQEISIQTVSTTDSGRLLLDFGQNLVGWLRLHTTGSAGSVITVRHAEVLEDGELGIRPLRTAKATDVYTLSGGSDEFEPTFTFHGFRYAEIDGWPGTVDELRENVVAVVIGSDLERIGTFECSDPLVNQLHANVVWGMRGNFVGVPTDCPQRDERLGWTGDLAAFAPTAAFLYDVNDFLQDWLRDLAAEQSDGGTIPVVVPNNMKYENFGEQLPDSIDTTKPMPPIALWSDAAVWVPWAMWEAYGDDTVLEAQYASISAYVRQISETLSETGVIGDGFQFGDWLDPTAPPENPVLAKADPLVVATACIYRSVDLAARIATILGKQTDAERFGDLAARIRTGFHTQYWEGGKIRSDAAAIYSLAICFDLLDEDKFPAAGTRLAELVEEAGCHIITGFAGTPFILHALSRTGHLDTAYRLLLQQESPSWLYAVTMGATTVWERWDSLLPDGSINPGEMTSFNHYAFGAVADWLHKVVGGLTPLEPGYRRFRVNPQPGGGITSATTRLRTLAGPIEVAWRQTDVGIELDLTVPLETTAVVNLDGSDTIVGSGTHRLSVGNRERVMQTSPPRLT